SVSTATFFRQHIFTGKCNVRLNARVVRANTAALLVALLLASPVAARSADARSTAGVVTAAVQIDNFGRVNQSYYRGAQPEGRDYADLAALGIRTVINLTS